MLMRSSLLPRVFNDMSTCWHGSGIYEDCNSKLWSRNIMIRYYGGDCKWWHFYPEQREADLDSKYKEILAGRSESSLLSGALSGVRAVLGRKKIDM